MSDPRDDPFDPTPVEDKVEEYQMAPEPEPDDERPVVERVIDPEAPLDAPVGALEDDWEDGAPAEGADEE